MMKSGKYQNNNIRIYGNGIEFGMGKLRVAWTIMYLYK